MGYFLGIDLGTQSIKVALYNPDNEFIICEDQEYYSSSDASMEEYFERDINIYWDTFSDLINKLLNKERVNPEDIKALSFSVLGETFVPTDENFNPLCSAFSGHDTRGLEEARTITEKFGNDLLQKVSGQPNVEVFWPAVKILWMKHNKPETFHKAKRYLNLEDYIIYKLTDKFISEKSMLCTSLYYDINEDKWFDPMLDFLEIEEKMLPEVMNPCEVVGSISKKASEITGLSTNTLIVLGAMDQIAGATGSGNIKPGVLTETTGTSLAIGLTYVGNLKTVDKKIPQYFHAIKNHYFLLPWSPSGGIALKWLKDVFFNKEKKIYEESNRNFYRVMDEMAAEIPAGSGGIIVLPYVVGSVCPESNANAKAVFFGMTIEHNRKHLIRATMEATANLIRANIDLLHNSGIECCKIVSLGGGSRSDLWCQIKADVCRTPVETLKYGDISAPLGACFMAAIGSGYFKSHEAIIQSNMLKTIKTFNPIVENSTAYDTGYDKFLKLYNRNLDLF